MVQETPALETHNQSLKVTTYNYDLISGNVNSVYFQRGERDEFDHKYEYDADNRMHASYSSRDGVTWEKESKQFYYTTGGMGRLEIGDKTVQGEDYAYTINGWMKAMNRNTIGDNGTYMERDLGQDAHSLTNNLNKNFGADAAGFTLDYFLGDYTAVNSTADFEAGKAGTDYGMLMLEQFNGNIAGMVTAMNKNDETYMEVQGRLFTYDQLYRIKEALAYHMDATIAGSNTWHASYVQDNRYKESFTYDWNGNIKTVKRYDGTTTSAVLMDDLVYHYHPDAGTGDDDPNSNLLYWIEDNGASACSYTDDLDDQTGYLSSYVNYTYDATGAMSVDASERITGIDWNPYGKMKAVHKDQANNTNSCTSTEYGDADVEYLYTANQQRLCKIVKPHKTGGAGIDDQDKWTYYWYAYDASGQVMAVYKQTFSDVSTGVYKVHVDVQEHDVYGSGRVGIRLGDDEEKYDLQFTGTKETSGPDAGKFNSITYGLPFSPAPKTHYTRELGNKQYEISNHLGNVLVTVSDKRQALDVYTYSGTGPGSDYTYNPHQNSYNYTPMAGLYTQSAGSDGLADWYTPDVVSYTDYYAFGAPMGGRHGGDPTRYGFNGKENDDEVKGVEGSTQDYGMRMYDARVGRFFSADPLMFSYPHYTPYQFAGNKPITYIDLDGMEEELPVSKGAGSFHKSSNRSHGTVTVAQTADYSTYNQGKIGGEAIDLPNSTNTVSSEPAPQPAKATLTEMEVVDPGYDDIIMAIKISSNASGKGFETGVAVGVVETAYGLLKGLANTAKYGSMGPGAVNYYTDQGIAMGIWWGEYGELTNPNSPVAFSYGLIKAGVSFERFRSTATPFDCGRITGKVIATAGIMYAGRFISFGVAAAEEGVMMGDLTIGEINAIQAEVNSAGRPLEVIGSAARGTRRGIGSDLPIGKGPGTMSDIDYITAPSSLRYFSNNNLPLLDIKTGIIPGHGNPSIGPFIRFEPYSRPVFTPIDK
jgi:RHS repeat-associated protein